MNLQSLREQFDDFGVEPSQHVLEKCLEICSENSIEDPAEFVEKWMAFSISQLNGAEPTVEYLIDMDNKELKKQKQVKNLKRSVEPSYLKVYNSAIEGEDEEENELLGSYVCITPKNEKKAASRLHLSTPEVPKTTFSPVSYSPLTTAKKSRIESSKAGNIVYNFGNFSAASAVPRNFQKILITYANSAQCIGEQSKYLTTSIMDDGQYITERIFQIGSEFCKKILHDEKRKDADDHVTLSHCNELSQENVRCLGKVLCSRSDKLDQKSCIFVGFDENKMRIVQLDLLRLKPSIQLFPGEVCIIGGNNPRGKMFSVTELHSERILESYPLPTEQELMEPVSMVIASGPFTSNDNLLFEHLDKLIENCQNNKPNVLILTGTFFNSKTKLIFDLAAEIDDHFAKMLEKISEKLGDDTKIIIVPSCDDINSSSCYPTKAYKLNKTAASFSNIFLATDPCILDINGIKIGLTSTDITKHLDEYEFCINAGNDKIRRYINYLFHQKSFYPLFPPKIPTDVRLLHEYATIDKIPHIMIAPSDLKYYMRAFNNCLCINPGRVLKDDSEGTFARVIVQPTKNAETNFNINSWITGQIIVL